MYLTTKKPHPVTVGELSNMVRGHLLGVGDELSITLTDDTAATLVVLDYTDDGKGVYLNFKDCIAEHYMNPTRTNEGGYFDSAMREYLAARILPLIPGDIAAHIVPREIKQIFKGKEYIMTDKLWLLSEEEALGKVVWGDRNGDKQFAYFMDPSHRIKFFKGESDWWWVRSPDRDGGIDFSTVATDGYAGICFADSWFGVSPAFIFA